MSISPKLALLEEYALVARALSAPARLMLLEQLAQGERGVEALADKTGLTIANCSQHLQQLRRPVTCEIIRQNTKRDRGQTRPQQCHNLCEEKVAIGAVGQNREHFATSEILGDGLELGCCGGAIRSDQCIIKAVVDMVLDQGPFGLLHGFLHCVKLLRDIHAKLSVLDHPDHAGKVTIGAFQPLHDDGVGCMMG